MNKYRVSVQEGSGRWCVVGDFKARSSSGAMKQFARDLHHFPNVTAIKAEQVRA